MAARFHDTSTIRALRRGSYYITPPWLTLSARTTLITANFKPVAVCRRLEAPAVKPNRRTFPTGAKYGAGDTDANWLRPVSHTQGRRRHGDLDRSTRTAAHCLRLGQDYLRTGTLTQQRPPKLAFFHEVAEQSRR